MEDDAAIAELAAAWETSADGATAAAYGRALEQTGRVDDAERVYRHAIADGYYVLLYDLAWLERDRGQHRRAIELLESYLDEEAEPDEFTPHVVGVIGHWRWHFFNEVDAEPQLRAGADHYPSARADLAKLLIVTGRPTEAIEVLEVGVEKDEEESFLPLANIVEEAGDDERAEELLRAGAALGDAFSAYNLHLILERLDRDDEAQEWLWTAARGGDEWAIKKLSEME